MNRHPARQRFCIATRRFAPLITIIHEGTAEVKSSPESSQIPCPRQFEIVEQLVCGKVSGNIKYRRVIIKKIPA